MRREDSDDDEGSALTVTPGTTGDLDGLAAALSGIELASKAPENSSGYQGVGNPGGPDTILARALAGIAEDASTPPPPASAQPRRSPRLKPFPATPAGTGGVGDGEEFRKPKLVVRYKRENVTPAASAANTPEKGTPKESFETARESFSEVKADEDGQEESSPAPVSVATLASRYVVVEPEVDEEEKEKVRQPPSTSPAVKPPVHRKPRSKVKTKPRDPSSFAAFREMRREQVKATAKASDAEEEADALASMFEKKVSVEDTPSRRGGRKAPARAVREGDDVGVVGLCYSDVMELHEGPSHHFERPARHAVTVARMRKDGLEEKCDIIAAREATDEELLTCHSREHLEYVASAFDRTSDEKVQGVGDIYWTEHTERCARTAAGSACAATDAVAGGTHHRAFAVVRPPGHHAECARAMGFCFYNNTAVAARAALAAHPHVNRVLLLDWDVHHGNGIQDVLYRDSRVMYVSLHRYGDGFYPETGAMEETGTGEGVGYNVNVPWTEKGLGDADYLAAFDLVIDPIAKSFDPDLVIIAAGFDAAEGDPLGGMKVTDQGYALMTERLVSLAGGKCVAALEGGYGLTATASAAAATLGAMLGYATPPLSSRRRPKRSTVETLGKIIEVHKERWPVLASEEHQRRFRSALEMTKVAGKERNAGELEN